MLASVSKLAMAGESAGFSVEQMIELLNAGVSIEALLQMIAWRLDAGIGKAETKSSAARWMM